MSTPATINVAGTRFHQENVRKIQSPADPIQLIREPENRFDKNAIAVVLTEDQSILGYLPRIIAAELAPIIDATGIPPEVRIKSINNLGFTAGIGIMIDIELPDYLLEGSTI